MGSPVSHVPLPPHVAVLSLENGGDLTPDVDGAVDPDRRSHVSVQRPAPVDTAEPWSAHEIGAYAGDGAARRRERAPLAGGVAPAGGAVPRPRAEVITQEFSTLREQP